MTDQKATVRLSAEALAKVLAAEQTPSEDDKGVILDIVEPPPANAVDVDVEDDEDYERA